MSNALRLIEAPLLCSGPITRLLVLISLWNGPQHFVHFVNVDIDFSLIHPRTIGLSKLNTYEMTKGILS